MTRDRAGVGRVAVGRAAAGAFLAAAPWIEIGCGGNASPPSDGAMPAGPTCHTVDRPPRPPLADVTRAWGLETHVTSGGAVCLIDFDGDADLDVYVTDHGDAPNRLFRNDGAAFVDVAGEVGADGRGAGTGCLAVDYDADGDSDLYVGAWGPDRLLRNEGGRFVDVTEDAGIVADGLTTTVTAGDIDGDLDLDIAAGRSAEEPSPSPLLRNLLFVNQGDGTFREEGKARGLEEEEPTLVVRFVDLDADLDVDLHVGNDFVQFPDRMYLNDGAGFFVDRAHEMGMDVPSATMGIAYGDYDLDGSPDAVVTNIVGEPTYLYDCDTEAGSGLRCREVASRVGLGDTEHLNWGAGFADLDHDGDDDVLLVSGRLWTFLGPTGPPADERTQLYWNDGGRFAPYAPPPGDALDVRRTSRGLAVGDLDDDGDLDAVVGNLDASPQVLRNDASAGHWLQVRLVGLRSNIEGIGARVRVTAGACTMTRWKVSGGSYLSSDDPRLHFGLGPWERADVEVIWPSGTVERLAGVRADQALAVVEGPRR